MRRALPILLVCSLSAPALAAPDKVACIEAHEDAQKLRGENKLARAKEKLLVCAADACPSLVKLDCTKWLPEVDRDQPTFIVRAKQGRNDIADVRVLIDGVVVAKFLDGKAIPIDPGAHTLRLERAGDEPIEQQLVVASGEKNRLVKVVFAAPAVEAPPPPAPATRGPLPWILTGVHAAAVPSHSYVSRLSAELPELTIAIARLRTVSKVTATG